MAVQITMMMTLRVRRFYLLALWTPLIAPTLVAGGFAVEGGGSYTGTLAAVGMMLVLSLWTTGLPYAIVALWVTRWLTARGREEREVRRLMWYAPLVVAAFAVPAWIVVGTVQQDILNGLGAGLIFLPYLLVLGYVYVALTAIIHELLSRTGFFRAGRLAQ